MVENDCGLVPIHRVGSNNYSKDAKIEGIVSVNILIQMKVRFHGNGI